MSIYVCKLGCIDFLFQKKKNVLGIRFNGGITSQKIKDCDF